MIYETINNVVTKVAQNSGSILSTLSVSSLSGYIMGILWSFQITSYYIFLPITKPKKLQLFLNATLQMQNVQILPFSIPTPFD